eukprot:UN08354
MIDAAELQHRVRLLLEQCQNTRHNVVSEMDDDGNDEHHNNAPHDSVTTTTTSEKGKFQKIYLHYVKKYYNQHKMLCIVKHT